MICTTIISKNTEEALKAMKKASKLTDLIELRIDYIKDINEKNLKKLLNNKIKPIIITNRKKSEGGKFEGNEKHRISLLEEAIKLKVDYVDIEYSTNKKLLKEIIGKKDKTKIIVSYHNFKRTPASLFGIFKKIKKLDPDIVKLVTFANSINENFEIFEFLTRAKKENEKLIAFCMGQFGQISRILCLKYGSFLTYCSLEKEKRAASGQLTLKELLNDYNIKKINKNTNIIGLIGNPVEHSFSHSMHNASFKKSKLNNIYVKFKADNLKVFMEKFRKHGFNGAGVTIPYKIEVMKYLDKIDKTAKKIRAVNTIVNKNGKLVGYGSIMAIKNKTKIKNKKIAILGAGGSARALVYGLKEEKGDITILNRTAEKAKKLAKEFNCNYEELNYFKNIDMDILVNATPVGMHPNTNQSLIPKKFLKNIVVFDVVFNPYKTKLIKDAEANNCKIIYGIEMLLYQGIKQFKLWTNKKISINIMRNSIIGKLK
jgi:3-dehydroquinate dehydratase/shikimate dehydrogenase